MANQLPPGQAPTVRGTIDATPCPHCGKANDLRVLAEQQLLDTGHKLFCDHCEQSMEVVSIRPLTLVTVRKDPNGGSARRTPAQRARQQQIAAQQRPQQQGIMGGLRKLLGGPKR